MKRLLGGVLVELLANHLTANDAVILSEWYSDRLVTHIPSKHRDLVDPEDVPIDSQTGIARFLFAEMTDVDTRIRWKAAHGLLRLAILREQKTIDAFTLQYSRTQDLMYRQPDAPFYDMAGRLWFVIALDQSALVAPARVLDVLGQIGETRQGQEGDIATTIGIVSDQA